MHIGLRPLLIASLAFVTQPFISAAPPKTIPRSPRIAVAPAFVRNAGLASPLARYVSVGGGQPIFFTTNDVRIVDPRRHRSLWLTFVDGAARGIDGEWDTGGHVTVLRHSNSATDEPMFRDVVYRDVWHGVDARVSAEAKGLKYSFEVAPGGDPRAIHLRYSGADRMTLTDAGEITIDAGGATIIDTKPVAYQHIDGRKVSVSVRFVQFHSDVAFSIGNYDRTRPLVIDPTIVYATYLGSSGDDYGTAIAVDSNGAAYVAGSSAYSDLPTTPGAVQPGWHGDPNTVKPDVFVAKINATGNHFDYVTYLGGYDVDRATGIAVDAGGNAYVTGTTRSSDFPTTAGAYRVSSAAADGNDSFLAKLNSAGTALLYSTYLGGNLSTYTRSVAVDGSGNAYVVGWTLSNNFPVSASAQPNALSFGIEDAFLLKFDATGSQVLYATYIGGNGRDNASNVVSAGGGQVIIAGSTSSPSGIAHGAGYQQVVGGGVFKSTDGGQTFISADTPLGTSNSLTFAIDPSNASVVYQGTSDVGLLKTTDGGAHWTRPPATGGIGVKVYDVAVNPANTATVLVTTDSGIWRTEDAFATVNKVWNWTGSVVWASSLPSTAYALANYVLKSTDSGKTWTQLPFPDSNAKYAIAVSPSNASVAYIGEIDGYGRATVVKTADGGSTWSATFLTGPTGPYPYSAVTSLAIDPALTSSVWAGLSSGGLFHSSDSGATWTQVSGITVGSRIVFDGGTMYVADASIYKTTDRGATWSHLLIRGNRIQVQSLAVLNGTVFAGSTLPNDAFVWKVDTNSSTSSIVWGTYLGGSLSDYPTGLAIDGSGHPVLALTTASIDFPVAVSNPVPATALVKLTADGTSVLWGKFIEGAEAVVASDRFDNTYIAGMGSVGSPPYTGTHVARFDPSGFQNDGFTFGGDQSNVGLPQSIPAGIAAGPTTGDIFVTGATNTVDFPTSANAPQPNYASGSSDAFLTKVTFLGPVQQPPPQGGPNLALNKPTRASSIYSSQYASQYAVDGSTSTRWSSQFSDPQWIEVDLQANYNISEVILRWETAYGADYQVQISTDDATWTTIKTIAGGDGGVDDLTGLSGIGRYVRVYGTRRGTQWGYSLWQFEVYGTAAATSNTDFALHANAVSSSDYSSQYVAAYAVDGSSETRWSSQFSDPQWIYVDLGQEINVTRVRLIWENAYGADFQLQVSDDATNWTTFVTTQNNTSFGNDYAVSVTGRYVRMYGTRRATQWGYSLWAFEVYGNPVAAKTDFAVHRPVVSSSDYSTSYAAAYAVDGSAFTRWSSQFSDPQWIYVDLGQRIAINEVKLVWETAYGADYQIQVSDDAATWTPIATVTGGDGGTDDLTVSGTGRYVRMAGTRRGTQWGYSLWSFEVYGGSIR